MKESKIVVFGGTYPHNPVKLAAKLSSSKFIIPANPAEPASRPVDVEYPIESSLFGDVLFATFSSETGTLNPIPRKQLYASPIPQIETLADKASAALSDVKMFIDSISAETKPDKIITLLRQRLENLKVYSVNLAQKGSRAHMVDVVLGGRTIPALIDGGAEISVANPKLFEEGDLGKLKRKHVTLTGIGGTITVPSVTVPSFSVVLKGKKYDFKEQEVALYKTKHDILLSMDIQDHIEQKEGVTAWN